jgi:hypothetical protein
VIACLHDCGSSVTAELTTNEAVEVSRKLADRVSVVPLPEARERDELEWATAREARRIKRNEWQFGLFRRS